jgi:hypothetical protein
MNLNNTSMQLTVERDTTKHLYPRDVITSASGDASTFRMHYVVDQDTQTTFNGLGFGVSLPQ